MNMTEVRQKVKLAREQMRAGDHKKARNTLKGVDHPKAAELREMIDEHLGDAESASFPLGRVLGLLAVVLVMIGGTAFFMSGGGEPEPTIVLPTLAVIPTSDCTPDTVEMWWGAVNIELDTFIQDSAAASRTIPGERLNERIGGLRQMRAGIEEIPACASTEMKVATNQIKRGMDDSIRVLTAWSNTNDADAVTRDLPGVQETIRDAMEIIQQEIEIG